MSERIDTVERVAPVTDRCSAGASATTRRRRSRSCDDCHGSGQGWYTRCDRCGGSGEVDTNAELAVTLRLVRALLAVLLWLTVMGPALCVALESLAGIDAASPVLTWGVLLGCFPVLHLTARRWKVPRVLRGARHGPGRTQETGAHSVDEP